MTALWIVLAVAAALILLLLWAVFPDVGKNDDIRLLPKSLVAHRGLHDLADDTPENSLAAYRAAVEKGYTIETDLHLTADGTVVVFHDADLNRMCGENRRIEEMTLEEIKQVRLAGGSQEIPTLQEMLDAVNGAVPLLIEFKCARFNCYDLCRAADKLLSGYRGKYIVQSFYPPVLWWYRRHRKDVCRGQLAHKYNSGGFLKRMSCGLLFNWLSRPHFISFAHGGANSIFFRLCIKLGAYPVGWTFRSQVELDRGKKSFKAFIFEGFIPK